MVPAMKATPSMTASAVVIRRSFLARSEVRVTLHMVLLSEALDPVEHALGGRVGHVVDDLAVGEEHGAVCV